MSVYGAHALRQLTLSPTNHPTTPHPASPYQAFAPARFARSATALFSDDKTIVQSKVSNETCEARRVDKNGRCPGEAGYMPPNNKAPASFADFQKEMAAKKAAGK